jgi:hypothetical protein
MEMERLGLGSAADTRARAKIVAGAFAGMEFNSDVWDGEKQIRGSGVSLEPPGPLPVHLRTIYMEYSECMPSCLEPPG